MGIRFDRRSAGAKAVLIGLIVVLLLIPLSMVRGLVSERSGLREQAYARVAEGWGGGLVLGGPMLVVPTERKVLENGVAKLVRRDVYLLPTVLDVGASLDLEAQPRHVGIYAVPVYLSRVRLVGRFDLTAFRDIQAGGAGATYLWRQSRLRLPLSEVRSLREVEGASFAGNDVKLRPAGPGVFRGVEAPLDLSDLREAPSADFDFRVVLAGSREWSVLPLGSTTTAALRSNWPHPSFQGAFLPADRSISSAGFDARWQVLELNRSYPQSFLEGEVDENMLRESSFGVGLYQAVDVYQRGERAIKYAALFIALTFLTFFAWEQASGERLHPLQYLLVGLALSTFYLLLIALSEHIAFALAYAAATTALVLLIAAYLAGALRSRRRGMVAGSAVTVVYGLLYVLVLSEDYALLLGAVILFAALAAAMLATRKVDWYEPAATQD